MKSLAEIYAAIPIWKDGYKYCDKGDVHSYIEVYESLFAPYRRPGTTLLEIGLFHGASMRMFEGYFAEGDVWGIDASDQPHGGMANLRPMIAEGTHNIIIGDATDPCSLSDWDSPGMPPLSFDIIIDDAAHNLSQQLALYAAHRRRLRPGGLYIIEDIENLDRDRAIFAAIDPSRRVEILDRRHVKGRFDDVLLVVHG